MRVSFKDGKKERGSVLVAALGTTVVLAIGATSYLALVAHQRTIIARSEAWNTALASAEAGIEEGMGQLNVVFGTNSYHTSAKANWGLAAGGGYGPRTGSL